LVTRAAELGMSALALTDHMTLAGVVRFQASCVERHIRPIVGCELEVAAPTFGDDAEPAQFVALARNAAGYAALCWLLTDANLENPDQPVIPFAALVAAVRASEEGLFVLTGGRDGALNRLLLNDQGQQAAKVAKDYTTAFGPERIFVELRHHTLPDSLNLMQRLGNFDWRLQGLGEDVCRFHCPQQWAGIDPCDASGGEGGRQALGLLDASGG
jgi:DNA polymerase III alpha subunit